MKQPYSIIALETHIAIRDKWGERNLTVAEARWVSEQLARAADEITKRCDVALCDRIAEVRASFAVTSDMQGKTVDFCANHKTYVRVRDIDTGEVLFDGGAAKEAGA